MLVITISFKILLLLKMGVANKDFKMKI